MNPDLFAHYTKCFVNAPITKDVILIHSINELDDFDNINEKLIIFKGEDTTPSKIVNYLNYNHRLNNIQKINKVITNKYKYCVSYSYNSNLFCIITYAEYVNNKSTILDYIISMKRKLYYPFGHAECVVNLIEKMNQIDNENYDTKSIIEILGDINNKCEILGIINVDSLDKWKCINGNSTNSVLSNYTHKMRDMKRIVYDTPTNMLLKHFDLNENVAHYFTYIITPKYWAYGLIKNNFEYGAGHQMLVKNENDEVMVGGEIKIMDNKLLYNFHSGTYSKKKRFWKRIL